jgi:hypothetical protein
MPLAQPEQHAGGGQNRAVRIGDTLAGNGRR